MKQKDILTFYEKIKEVSDPQEIMFDNKNNRFILYVNEKTPIPISLIKNKSLDECLDELLMEFTNNDIIFEAICIKRNNLKGYSFQSGIKKELKRPVTPEFLSPNYMIEFRMNKPKEVKKLENHLEEIGQGKFNLKWYGLS